MAPARRRAGLLLAVAAVAATGCGGGTPKDRARERVEAYSARENAVVGRLRPDVDRVNRTYVAFSKGKLEPAAAVAQLTASERVIRAVRADVGDLKPPAEARELQRRLEHYLGLTVDLAVQTRLLASYQPAAQAALKPLPAVNRRLQRELRKTKDPQGQEAVLARFADGLGGVIADLRAVEVPAVQAPAHRDQVRRLQRTRALAGRLRRALGDQDAERVAILLGRFRRQAQSGADDRRLTRAGLAAYGRRVDALKAASADLQREQIRVFRAVD